jgi:hypothetical protein
METSRADTGLVEDDEARGDGKGPRDGDALALAARELVGKQVARPGGQPHDVEELGHPCGHRGAIEALVGDERLRDDGIHAHARIERGERILEDGLDALAVEVEALALQSRHVLVLEEDLARRRLLEPEHELGRGRLTAAALPHHAERAPGLDGEGNVVHRPHHAPAPADETAANCEVLGEAAGFEEGRHPLRAPARAGAATQQRVRCCAATSLSGGASARHRSTTNGQRG